MNVIADVTKSFQGTVVKVLEKIRRDPGAPVDAISVLMYDDQQAELQMAGVDVSTLTIKAISRTTLVADVALEMILDGAGKYPDSVVFSFHPNVLDLGIRLPADCRVRVHFYPWGKAQIYFSKTAPQRAVETAPPGTYGEPITEADALAVLKATLEAKGATSRARGIQQTNIRPLMASRDARFLKTNPAAAAPNFVSMLLRRASQLGLVVVETTSDNAMIWLSAQQRLFKESTEIVANAPAANAPIAPSQPAAEREMAANAEVVRPMDCYLKILLDGRMGPFANVRDDLYSALECQANGKLTLDRMITECLATAEEKHKDHPNIPWKTSIRGFFTRLLTRRPVLFDANGEGLVPSWQTGQTVVKSLDPKVRDKLDGELVLYLLEQDAEITYEDRGSLIGALYVNRGAEYDDRMSSVMAYLSDAGLIQMLGGSIKLAPAVSEKVTSLPQRTVQGAKLIT